MKSKTIKSFVGFVLLIAWTVTLKAQTQTGVFTDRALGVNVTAPSVGGFPQVAFLNYAPVRVCTSTAVGSPCSPLAAIFDLLGNPLSVNPGAFGQLTTDFLGRFSFGCSTGTNFLIQIAQVGSNTPQVSYQASCPGTGPTITATALMNQIILGTAPNQTTLNAPAPVGNTILTFPVTTDTMVGRTTTDNLSNKTLLSPTISGITNDISAYVQTGSQTVGNWNKVRVIDGTKYALTDVGLNSALSDAGASGTVLIPPNTTVVLTTCPISIANNLVSIVGLGPGSQIQVNCLGDVFTGAGQVVRFANLNILIGSAAARTGSLFTMTGSEPTFQDLRIVGISTITNNGKIFTFGAGANNAILRGIRIPGGVTWTYLAQWGPLTAAQGTVGSAELSDLEVSNTITWTTGGVVLDSGTDTITMTNTQLGSGSASTSPILWLKNTSTSNAPRWVKCQGCYIDGGTGASVAIQLDGAREFRYQGYIASVKNAVVVAAGAGVSEAYIRHGEITNIQQHGVIINGGINIAVQDESFTDIGVQTANTYDGVNVAAGTTSFKIDRNNFKQISATTVRNWINVLAGASDLYSITHNNFHSNAATTNLVDGGTAPSGARSVWGNIPSPAAGVEKMQSQPNFLNGAIFAALSFFRAGIQNDAGDLALTSSTNQQTVQRLKLLTGLGPDGGGAKHSRIASCITAAAAGSTCNTTWTFTTAFADANYTTACTIDSPTGVPYVLNTSSKAAASVIVTIGNLTAVAASGTLNCVAAHD